MRCRAGKSRGAVGRMHLLLDDLRAEQHVDLAFDRCPPVVEDVDVAGELDELGVEALFRLVLALGVLDVPEELVHRLQVRLQPDVGLAPAEHRVGDLPQRLQFTDDVRRSRRVGNAVALDLQDGDLVDQFSGGHGDEDHCTGPP